MKKILILGLILFIGCSGHLMKLNLGMTKAEVISSMGEPVAARGSIKNRFEQIVEVWEYTLWKGPTTADYWLYFVDGYLVRWGEAGDWGKEADRIYEIKFGDLARPKIIK